MTGSPIGPTISKLGRVRLLGLVFGAFLALWALSAASASAAIPGTSDPVSCGEVITHDTTLQNDLTNCPGDGIVIGADGITLDLNRHTVEASCLNGCPGQDGIDNSGGYDRVRIRNGTVRGFEHSVALVGANNNTLSDLTVQFEGPEGRPGIGILLSDSNDNKLDHSTISGGAPAVLLSGSDRNTISRSSIHGGVDIHTGDGLELRDGSDDNELVDSRVTALGGGIAIAHSADNRLTRNAIGAYAFGIHQFAAQRSVISHNTISTPWSAIVAFDSDQNVISHNSAVAELIVSGDRNRIEHNDVHGIAYLFEPAIWIQNGDGNLVRGNTTSVSGATDDEIFVASAATNTLIEGNLATGAYDDGIDVDAPGTLIRANTATNNGDLGIEAVAGVIDGGGNRASGNGNPLQCLNVACK
jgi:parallel beta-helix repeat protein